MKYLVFLLCFFSACKSKHYAQDNLPATQLRWGKGGGFTGAVKTCILLENGQIFVQKTNNAPLAELEKTRKKSAAALFEAAKKAGLTDLQFNHPGNTYQFIEWMQEGKSNRVIWGDAAQAAPPVLTDLYKQLNALLPADN
jgi:hypothetical protein